MAILSIRHAQRGCAPSPMPAGSSRDRRAGFQVLLSRTLRTPQNQARRKWPKDNACQTHAHDSCHRRTNRRRKREAALLQQRNFDGQESTDHSKAPGVEHSQAVACHRGEVRSARMQARAPTVCLASSGWVVPSGPLAERSQAFLGSPAVSSLGSAPDAPRARGQPHLRRVRVGSVSNLLAMWTGERVGRGGCWSAREDSMGRTGFLRLLPLARQRGHAGRDREGQEATSGRAGNQSNIVLTFRLCGDRIQTDATHPESARFVSPLLLHSQTWLPRHRARHTAAFACSPPLVAPSTPSAPACSWPSSPSQPR